MDPKACPECGRPNQFGVEQCTGALLHAAKTGNSYTDRWREAGRHAMKALLPLDFILGIEFMKHHKEKP